VIFFVNATETETINFKEFSARLKPSPKTLRISGMTWETYCREEAAECEKLARVVQGDDRKLWADAARQWRSQLAKRKPANGEEGRA
jgi:hypothetical protein